MGRLMSPPQGIDVGGKRQGRQQQQQDQDGAHRHDLHGADLVGVEELDAEPHQGNHDGGTEHGGDADERTGRHAVRAGAPFSRHQLHPSGSSLNT